MTLMTPVVPRHRPEVRSEASTVSRAKEQRIRIASFPPVIQENPYQRLLYRGLEAYGFELENGNRFKVGWLLRRGRRTVLHFHWLQGYYTYTDASRSRLAGVLSWARLCLFVARLLVARALGSRIVWTVHQVYPHESNSRSLDRAAALVMSRMSVVLLAHDAETANRVEQELRLAKGRVSVVQHGSYIGVYAAGRSRDVVRRELGVDGATFIFLAFGHVRAYKDIELLIDAFTTTREALPNAVLIVAGVAMDEGVRAAISAAARADDRIHERLEFVPDGRVAELFDAADVGVLARGDGGTSGALILALSLGLPVIAAETDLYRALVGEDGAGRFFEPGNPASLGAAFEEFASEGASAAYQRRPAALARAESLRWDDAAHATASLLAKVCG